MSHTCHAIRCNVSIAPELLMCRRHWYMVPLALRLRVLRTYRPGQCDDKKPNHEYCDAAQEAVRAVARLEGIRVTGDEPEIVLYDLYRPAEPRKDLRK